jgi:hypothetical protein
MMAVLGNILNAESTQTRANSAPTYTRVPAGVAFLQQTPLLHA